MMKIYRYQGFTRQFEEGTQPEGAVEIKPEKPVEEKAKKPANKSAKTANKAKKAAKK